MEKNKYCVNGKKIEKALRKKSLERGAKFEEDFYFLFKIGAETEKISVEEYMVNLMFFAIDVKRNGYKSYLDEIFADKGDKE